MRLTAGARFSFILAISVAIVNFILGAFLGCLEGYYGGVFDITMQRFSEILAYIPGYAVFTLFNLHLAAKLGAIPTLMFAYMLTGWMGPASLLRMQFYRFKNQEYVLAARTLGARDFRLMFKHILPNAIGTVITSSVLTVPGIIASESSLAYLGIVNLNSDKITSVGTLLKGGQQVMQSFPHIVLFPAIFIALLMISFNLFGNGLRDAFNPQLRGTEG
ncbi:MAG: ABC transporter permease [Clostridia bacterium]|nr:ABC transporter permease [Clostridia bacterium]